MDSIEDAGLALAYKAEGEAMLGLYQSSRHDVQNLRQQLKNALDRDDYLTNPSGKESVKNLQTTITKCCRNNAENLIARFKSATGKRSIREVKDSSEAFKTWCDNDLEDEVGSSSSRRSDGLFQLGCNRESSRLGSFAVGSSQHALLHLLRPCPRTRLSSELRWRLVPEFRQRKRIQLLGLQHQQRLLCEWL